MEFLKESEIFEQRREKVYLENWNMIFCAREEGPTRPSSGPHQEAEGLERLGVVSLEQWVPGAAKQLQNQSEGEAGCSHYSSNIICLTASDFSVPKSAPRFECS